jgi:uncharacterized protein YndB with AHSA1/START domain
MTLVDEDYGTFTEPRSIRIERMLPGPIERVWTYLTESEKRGRWLAAGDMGAQKGAPIELLFHNAKLSAPSDQPPQKYAGYSGPLTMVGTIAECDPPRRLSLVWGEAGPDPSIVTFELEPAGERVRLVLTHRRLGSRDGLLSVSAGWHAHIGILAALLEGREPESFWATHTRLEAEYDRRLGTGGF